MILDIGCGDSPRGDVNCDLFVGESPHLTAPRYIQPEKIPNFVRCDANCLPFRYKAFTESLCRHVIEHKGVTPSAVLKEIVRVTSDTVTIILPHRMHREGWLFSRHRQFHQHCRYFNARTVRGWIQKTFGITPHITVSYACFPHPYVCLIRLPREIAATIPLRALNER